MYIEFEKEFKEYFGKIEILNIWNYINSIRIYKEHKKQFLNK